MFPNMFYEVYSSRGGRIVAYKSVWLVQNEPAPPEPEHIDSDLPFANVTDAEIREMYPRYDWRDYPYDPDDYDNESLD